MSCSGKYKLSPLCFIVFGEVGTPPDTCVLGCKCSGNKQQPLGVYELDVNFRYFFWERA